MSVPGSIGLTALDPVGRAELVRWLGDSPFTALTNGQLAQGLCRAYAVGELRSPRIAVVRPAAEPAEPIAFGTDVEALWTILSRLPGWTCVNVDPAISSRVVSLLERTTRGRARIVNERYYVLEEAPRPVATDRVRRLGPSDDELVGRSGPLFAPFFVGHGSTARTLVEGVVAGAIQNGELVSAVTTSAWTGGHVDLGAATLPAWRGLGLATSAAHLVATGLRSAGRRPVWAAGESNRASWRIPEKLGFRFVGRREYVVLEGVEAGGFRPAGTASAPEL